MNLKTRKLFYALAIPLLLLLVAPTFAGELIDGGGYVPCCPVLYSYTQGAFVHEGHLILHPNEPNETITIWDLHYKPDRIGFAYIYEIREENATTDYLDNIILNVTYTNGLSIAFPAIYAISDDPLATLKLGLSDNWRFELHPAETIRLYFPALPFQISTVHLTVEGYGIP